MNVEVTIRHQPDLAGSLSSASIAPDQQSWVITPATASEVSPTAAHGMRRPRRVPWPSRVSPPLSINIISAAVVTLNSSPPIVTTPFKRCLIPVGDDSRRVSGTFQTMFESRLQWVP